MNNEQQMKAALDGKFFYFTHDGAVKCKEVNENFSGASSFNNNYSKEYMAKGGKKAIGSKKHNRITWSEGQVAWLKKNMDRKTIKQCAEALNVAYHRTYDKILALRKAGYK
jgi:hypothetical protein